MGGGGGGGGVSSRMKMLPWAILSCSKVPFFEKKMITNSGYFDACVLIFYFAFSYVKYVAWEDAQVVRGVSAY